MRLGIDFGTTNSAIAFYDGNELVPVEVDAQNENHFVLPSLIFVDRAFQAVVGTDAAYQYLEHETGRYVRWEKRHLGQVDILVAGTGSSPIHYIQDVHTLVDEAANGRLLQSVKTGLRNPGYEGTQIFERFFTINELIAAILSSLKQAAEERFQQKCDEIVLGRPVKFSDDVTIDRRAEEILFSAAHFAGFRRISFEQEPIAAARVHHLSSPERHVALVFDFGGGTLDLTVIRAGGHQPPEILSTRGVLVGGDDLDRRIMGSLLKYFGQDLVIDGHPLPGNYLDLLLNWQTMPEVSRPHNMQLIRDMKRLKSSNPRALEALETLVSRNLGFKLFREIERAKRELSTKIITRLNFEYGPIKIREVITRSDFEKMIQPEVDEVEAGVRDVVAQANLTPADIDVVLRTGGTSRVPAFADMLASIFGRDKLQDMDPFTSVVGGMAVAAHEKARPVSDFAPRYKRLKNVIQNIRTENGKTYKPYILHVGKKSYIDRTFEISRCPALLNGLPSLRTAFADRDAVSETHLQFEITQPMRIFVAFEAGADALPVWLRKFHAEDLHIHIRDDFMNVERILKLYSRDFEPGTVMLGGTSAPGYTSKTAISYLVVMQRIL